MDFKIFTNALGLSSNKESSTPLIKKKEESSDVVYEERKEILTWNSEVVGSTIPKRYKSAILIIGTLLLIYLILNRDAVLVVLILSLVFLYGILNSTNKNTYTYKIYNNGIDYFGTFYTWDKFRFYFFFTDKNIIGIDTVDIAPGRLYIYFNPEDREKIDNILSVKLDKALVVPKNYLDKIVDKIKPYIDLSER
jgi:hypothetical protein